MRSPSGHHRIRAYTEFGRTIRLAAAAFVAMVLVPGLKYPPNPPTVGDPDTINDRTMWYLILLVVSVVLVAAAFRMWERLTAQGLHGASRFVAVSVAFLVALTLIWVLFPKSPDPIDPPDNEAPPALQVAQDAPEAVLDQALTVGRETGTETFRNPQDPSRPLDLDTVETGADLRGVPVAISTAELRPDAYATMVWHFRTQTFAGMALLWIAMGTMMGWLLDRSAAEGRYASGDPDDLAP